jgi:DNA mismatch repair protein MutS2
VLADIGDRQSIEMSLSTFSGHIANLVEILADATDHSLVLVDEIASGTDPEEGSALAQALVERLAQQARLTVVTTHYHELREWASARDDAVNAATSLDPETNTPNYRITLGRPGISHALQTAARLGLDESVVAAARSASRPSGCGSASCSPRPRRRSAARRACSRLAGNDAGRRKAILAEIEKVRASAQRERELAAADAQRELADARVELQALRDDMREARRRKRDQPAVDRALGAASTRAANAERALRDLEPLPVLTPLAPGDPVESDVGVRGTIASISGDEPRSSRAVTACGSRSRGFVLTRREEVSEPAVKLNATISGDVSDEIDVRGQRAQEAREAVRAFVDEASLAGLSSVRVIHGRGTGSVRAAVRDELDKHPLVDRREPEANDGATLAHLSS